MNSRVVAILIAGTAALAMQPANAADIPVKAPGAVPYVISSGFFGYVQGNHYFRDSREGVALTDAGGLANHIGAGAGEGTGVSGLVGYRFANRWDFAVGARSMDFRPGLPVREGSDLTQITDNKIRNLDFEVGYTFGGLGWSVRPFAGVRYLEARTAVQFVPPGIYSSTARSEGTGPRVGIDGAVALNGWLGLFASADVSALSGKVRSEHNAALAAIRPNGSDDRWMWTAGGKFGVAWKILPLLDLAAGFQAEWFDGISFHHFAGNTTVTGPAGRSGRFAVGPFARLTYNMSPSR